MLTREEHLLVILGEECAEVAQIVSKCLRFGMDERNVLNPEGPTNRERLAYELTDLSALTGPVVAIGLLPPSWFDAEAAEAKKSKVRKFMRLARELKTLEPEKETES